MESVNLQNSESFERRLLLQTLKAGENLLMSPYCIYLALCLLSNGANGETKNEMFDFLKINASQDEFNVEMKKMLLLLSQKSEDEVFEIANAIFTKPETSDMMNTISENIYQAKVEKLLSVEQVNQWVSNKTHGKINNILNSIECDMILISTIYFLGKWVYSFDKNSTKLLPFYGTTSTNNICPFMNLTIKDKINYYSNNFYEYVELPYKGNNISAHFFLPKQNTEIDKVFQMVIESGMNEIKPSCKYEIQLSIPKFSFRQNIQLKEILAGMGMKLSMSTAADFTSLTRDMVPLFVQEVIHETFIEINEEGTEAAAVTAIKMTRCISVNHTKKIKLEFNRPFILLIKHQNIEQILFAAKIENL